MEASGVKEQSDGAVLEGFPSPKRMNSDRTTQNSFPKAYKVNFSCHNLGRFVRKSKRRIKWCFGLTNTAAILDGLSGIDCGGEEHEVILILSSKSCKAKLYWNQRDITHYFHDGKGNRSGNFQFAWQSRSGETFKVIAYTNPPPGEPQFELFVDEVCFSDLPDLADFGPEGGIEIVGNASSLNSWSPPITDEDVDSGFESGGDFPSEHISDDFDFRLSIVGYGPGSSVEVVDELRSELYSSTLDAMQRYVKEWIPQSEDMISRAIINAFNSDSDSQASNESEFQFHKFLKPVHLEADAVREACEWVRLNKGHLPQPDIGERSLDFLQDVVNSVICHIRHDRLPAAAACRILISVCLVIGVRLAKQAKNDTLILNGMNKNMSNYDLIQKFSVYGDVLDVATLDNWGFGICRFTDEGAVDRVMAESCNNSFSSFRSEIEAIALVQFADQRATFVDSTADRYLDAQSPSRPHSYIMTCESGNDQSPIFSTPRHLRGSRDLVKNLSLNSDLTSSTEAGDSTDISFMHDHRFLTIN